MFQRLPKRSWGQGKKLARLATVWASGQLYIPQNSHEDPDAEFDEAAAALGLLPEKGDTAAPDDKVYLWPENFGIWRLWHQLQTQWRTNAGGGRDGLDYAGVGLYLREVWRVKQRDFVETFFCITAMEHAALEVWGARKG